MGIKRHFQQTQLDDIDIFIILCTVHIGFGFIPTAMIVGKE